MVDGDVDPGTVRPGGRTARVRAAVLRAAGDALAEHGFAHLDLADVARRAEVGKTTVYRRWGTVTGLVADLLTDMAEQSLAAHRDRLAARRPDGQRPARTAHPGRPAAGRAVQGGDRRRHLRRDDGRGAAPLLRRPRSRSGRPASSRPSTAANCPRAPTPHEVIRAVSAPLYYRLLTSGTPDEAAADRAAAAAAAAARAGAYLLHG